MKSTPPAACGRRGGWSDWANRRGGYSVSADTQKERTQCKIFMKEQPPRRMPWSRHRLPLLFASEQEGS